MVSPGADPKGHLPNREALLQSSHGAADVDDADAAEGLVAEQFLYAGWHVVDLVDRDGQNMFSPVRSQPRT